MHNHHNSMLKCVEIHDNYINEVDGKTTFIHKAFIKVL